LSQKINIKNNKKHNKNNKNNNNTWCPLFKKSTSKTIIITITTTKTKTTIPDVRRRQKIPNHLMILHFLRRRKGFFRPEI
jgi:hypothetical protein